MPQQYEYGDTYAASLEYFKGNDLPAKVFSDKYALRTSAGVMLELTPDDMHMRLANEFARIEHKKFKEPMLGADIYGLLKGFGCILPQGSPMYGIGNTHQRVSLSNCYVLTPPPDSYGGIMYTDQQLVQISKRRGGCGISLDALRPEGETTQNSSRTSTGIVSWAKRYSNSTREVGQSGRRGALMLSLNVHHPQVLDFAHCKDVEGEVTGANISICLTNEFLEAVKGDKEYEQRWPIDSKTPTVSRMVKARDVWNEIIQCAHNRAEPGLLFWDKILEESPADCYLEFITVSTNPCSEIPLSILDSCRLMALNLFSCVSNPFTPQAKFDYKKLFQLAKTMQRLMDDLVDLEIEAVNKIIKKIDDDPENKTFKAIERETWLKIREVCKAGRRTGSGITALGDAMAACGIKYGSPASLRMVNKVYKTLKLGAYWSSVEMAEELGAFPVWDHNKEKNNPFLLRIKDEDPELWKAMKKHGRRNIALLTTAPTGTTSCLASLGEGYYVTTAGIEPLFKQFYIRRKKITHTDKDFRVDHTDTNGDRWQHFNVYHSGVKMWMDVTGETDIEKSPYHGACAEDIDWNNRVKLQAIAQKHVDHAISSTINLPSDVSVDTVREIYETAWKAGCKGITVYRDGCRDGVLIDAADTVKPQDAPERPKTLHCDIHHHTVKTIPHFVLVGLLDGRPYEVFAGRNGFLNPKHKTGQVVKILRPRCYRLEIDGDIILQPIATVVDEDQEALTRMISTGLRHGTPLHFMVDQLEKVEGDMHSFARCIARALKKYIADGTKVDRTCPECESESLVRQEGCVKCMNCGYSGCS